MKVLLLYPEFPDTFWSFKHVLKFIRKRAALPPLGLLTVAAMLPEEWEKRDFLWKLPHATCRGSLGRSGLSSWRH